MYEDIEKFQRYQHNNKVCIAKRKENITGYKAKL